MLLCGGINLSAQNCFERKVFDEMVERGHKLYHRLTQEEKRFCDIETRAEVVRHAQNLQAANRSEEIPREIDPHESVQLINSEYMTCCGDLIDSGCCRARFDVLIRIAIIRMVDLWQKKADSIGRQNTYTLMYKGTNPDYWSPDSLQEAHELYKMLSPEEQKYCDLIYREEAVEHARTLTEENKQHLVPVIINPREDVSALHSRKRKLDDTLKLSETDQGMIFAVSARRMVALWQQKARLAGEKTSFRVAQFFEDSNNER